MINDYLDARAYLKGVRFQFDKTMTQDMKDALDKADEALAMVIMESKNITQLSPEELKEINALKEGSVEE